MSLAIQSALQSRLDRRSNVLREMEEERANAKMNLRFAYEDDDEGFIAYYKELYHNASDDIFSLVADQKLDKILLKQQVFNARKKRVKKNLRSVLNDAGYEVVVV